MSGEPLQDQWSSGLAIVFPSLCNKCNQKPTLNFRSETERGRRPSSANTTELTANLFTPTTSLENLVKTFRDVNFGTVFYVSAFANDNVSGS